MTALLDRITGSSGCKRTMTRSCRCVITNPMEQTSLFPRFLDATSFHCLRQFFHWKNLSEPDCMPGKPPWVPCTPFVLSPFRLFRSSLAVEGRKIEKSGECSRDSAFPDALSRLSSGCPRSGQPAHAAAGAEGSRGYEKSS